MNLFGLILFLHGFMAFLLCIACYPPQGGKTEEIKETTTPDYSPSDISNYFAFASHSHFINIFKKHTGITPNEYRKLHYQKYFEREANIS